MTTPPMKTRGGTHFPDLPKLPDPSAPLNAFLKSFSEFRKEANEAMKAGDQLSQLLVESAEQIRESVSHKLKAGIPKMPRK